MNDYQDLEQQIPIDIHINKLQDNHDKISSIVDKKAKFLQNQDFKDFKHYKDLFLQDNVEMSKIASHNNHFEIYGIKQELNELSDQINNFNKNKEEYINKSKFYFKEFESKCKEIGIEGNNIKKELSRTLDRLPNLFKVYHQNLLLIENSSEYYIKYIQALNKFNFNDSISEQRPVLPIIQNIYQNSDELYPLKVFDPYNNKNSSLKSISHQEIDNEFTIEVIDEGEEVSDIVSKPNSAAETEEKATITPKDDENLKEAREYYRKYLFGKLDFLENVSSELHELQSFFKQRFYEKKESLATENGAANLAFQLLQSTDDDPVFKTFFELIDTRENSDDGDWLKNMSNHVTNALNFLKSNGEFVNALLVLNDESYVDKICETLNQKKALSEKMLRTSKEYETKAKQASTALVKLREKLRKILKMNEILKDRIQKEISHRYNNRKVNIIGMTIA